MADPRRGPVHLVGGGWAPQAADAVYRPFVEDCAGGPIALIVETTPGSDAWAERFAAVLGSVGATDVDILGVCDGRRPTRLELAGVAGVAVGGGRTPGYHAALADQGGQWLPDVPFLGFSAGAAIAPRVALIGGYRIFAFGTPRVVSPPDTAEDLDAVTLADGLGIVPWTVDAHAAAWGTLGRLWHVVASGRVDHGFAIDEDTSLAVRDGEWAVAGLGYVYEVRRADAGAHIRAHAAAR